MALVKSEQRDYEMFHETGYENYTQNIATKTSYFQYEDKITRCKSDKRTGINAKSGTRWYRWVTTDVQSVRRDSAGKFHTCAKSNKVWGGLDYWSLERDTEWHSLFEQTFDQPFAFSTIHPLAPHYDLTSPPVSTGFAGSLKQANLRDQVASLFGKTRVRRDLMRAVGQSHHAAIMLAVDFRGLVPVDWLVDFLMRNTRQQGTFRVPKNGSLRPILYQMDPRSYRDLLRGEPITRHAIASLNDVIRYRRQEGIILNGRYRTFESLHTAFFGEARLAFDRQRYEPKPIPMTPLARRLSDIPGVVIPDSTEVLHGWGEQMSNCIGSYAYAMVSDMRVTELGGIYEDGKLIANFEIKNGALSQLLGRFNKSLPVGVRDRFESEFLKAGVKVPSEYWGSRDNV